MTYPAPRPRHAHTNPDWPPGTEPAAGQHGGWQTRPVFDPPMVPQQRPAEGASGVWAPRPATASPYPSAPYPSVPQQPATVPWPDAAEGPPALYREWHDPSAESQYPTTVYRRPGSSETRQPADGQGDRDGVIETDEPAGSNPNAGPAEPLDPMFLTLTGGRLVRATSGHAFYAQEHLGRDALEPGPHALLLLSAKPRVYGTADVVAAARMFYVGEADDMAAMLDGMAEVVTTSVAAARRDRRLLAYLSGEERVRLAAQVLPGVRWDAETDAFPYLQAVQQGLLWDPRMPQLGITATSDDDLTDQMRYVGVAVSTLDTEDATWESIKHRYAGATDPIHHLPLTPAHVPAHAWALLEGDTVLHVHRAPALRLGDKTHEVTANRPLGDSMTSRGGMRLDRTLIEQPPPVFKGTNLWWHLRGLHVALRSAFGYEAAR